MTRTVRFHEIGGPEVMRLEDLEIGEPGPGEVRSASTRSGSTGPRRCSGPAATSSR